MIARRPTRWMGNPKPEKINEAMRGVRSELVKSRETMTRRLRVATAVAATLADTAAAAAEEEEGEEEEEECRWCCWW